MLHNLFLGVLMSKELPDKDGTLFEVSGAKPHYLLKSKNLENLNGRKSHRFWLLDENGTTLEQYSPKFDCDCEYGIYTIFELRDGTLFEYFGRENDAHTHALCRWKARVMLNVWREVEHIK
jgi:hypothetical protein